MSWKKEVISWRLLWQLLWESRKVGQALEESFTAIQKARPTHPETGEEGQFVRYDGYLGRVWPVYRTKSGKEFTIEL